MRGLIGGMVAGALVSVAGLGGLSVINAPQAPRVSLENQQGAEPDAPVAPDTGQQAETETAQPVENPVESPTENAASSPVGSLEIDAPQTPDLPDDAPLATAQPPEEPEPATPVETAPSEPAPMTDTDPLAMPEVLGVEGSLGAPDTPEGVEMTAEMEAPVLPNPQAMAPQTPQSEADLVLSTDPEPPVTTVIDSQMEAESESDEAFIVDLGADAPQDEASEPIASESAPAPRLQLQGGQNTLLGERDTGVTIRRPATEAEPADLEGAALRDDRDEAQDGAQGVTSALTAFSAEAPLTQGIPLMAVVLIDDGSMPAAAAALAGLPFAVTIALDPAQEGATERMQAYRAAGYEIAVLGKLPEGALPSDVEVTFESVFGAVPEAIALLDIGEGGLQQDRAVTQQAMGVLQAQGRGLITASQGLNMAVRAAEQADVPAAVVYRELDGEGQDARVIRRFFDQAAFRARQESGVVLVGRVRPDTLSAMILWGAANQDGQVALVPVSAVLLAQE